MTAQNPLPLWPEDAPEVAGADHAEIPHLTPYLPTTHTPVAAMIVCPGGGYQMRADHEGAPIAEWLVSLGMAAFVVDYRVAPNRHPIPLKDAQRAIRTVRTRAAEWNVDPFRIGILGFSAGGHLAATAATQWDGGDAVSPDPIRQASSRPDLAVLCYPVITFVRTPHAGSVANLLGPDSTEDQRRAMSADLNVTAETPPTFLWHTADDAAVNVEHSLLFATALRHHGVDFGLHVYPSGVHGLGLAADHPEASAWPVACEGFLRGRGFIA
jgi:acetyl esterase/lipase